MMVDSPSAEEPLSATQPASTPAITYTGGAPRGDAAASVHTGRVVERDNDAVPPTPSLSFPSPAFVGATGSRETEDGPAVDLYPTLVPLPTAASMTRIPRHYAQSGASISPFRLSAKCHPNEADSKQNSPLRESLLPGTCENIDPVQQQMEQQREREAETTLKNGRPSLATSSVERLASSRCSSPLLEEMASARSREVAAAGSPASAEQYEAAACMPEQRIDAAWRRHVKSWCSTTSSLESSVSDLRLREETRRNTKRNASPLSARNLRAQLQQRQQQRPRKSSSPIRPQHTTAAAFASVPTTPLRLHVASWEQQRQDLSDGHTPPRPDHTGAIAASSVSAAAPMAAAVTAAAVTPTTERPTTGGNSVRSILRAASASGSSNSLSARRVVFTPAPMPQRLNAGEGRGSSPWLDQRATTDEETQEAAPGSSAAATLEPAEAGIDALTSDCGNHPPTTHAYPAPTVERQHHPEEQLHGVQYPPDGPSRRPSEHRTKGSANDSSEQLQQPNEESKPDDGGDEAQLQPQQHRESSQDDMNTAEVQLEAEAASEGMVAAAEAARTAEVAQREMQVTRTRPIPDAVALGESISEPVPASTTGARTDLNVESEDARLVLPVGESRPAAAAANVFDAEAIAADVIAVASTTGAKTLDGLEVKAKEEAAAQVLVPPVAAPQVSVGEEAREPEYAGGLPAARISDCATDSVNPSNGSVNYCSSSTRVLVVNSGGETELLLQSSSCLVAPALSEPLRADPTPLRKAPARPPSGPEARAAAAAAARFCASFADASPPVTTGNFPDAADGAVVDGPTRTADEKKTVQQKSDEDVENNRGQAAAARHLPLQQQQQQATGPLRSPNDCTEVTPESESVMHQENLAYTAEMDGSGSAAVSTCTPGLAAVQTDAGGGCSNAASEAASCSPQSVHLQRQQQQDAGGGGDAALPDASETSSTPVTPFAGPDPLSGDAPLSPRLAVPSGRGGSRIVSTSAMSFLLSVRHQLEAEAVIQRERQPHQQEQQQPTLEHQKENTPFQDLLESSLCRDGCETREEGSQARQQQHQQERLEQEEQQQLDAEEPEQQLETSRSHQQQREVEGVLTPGTSQVATVAEVDTLLAETVASAAPGAAASSRCSSGARSEATDSQATPFKHSSKDSDSQSADSGGTSGRRSSSSVILSSGPPTGDKEGRSGSSNPPWRAQWKALDALTSRLLQGLPRALTVIAEGEGGSPTPTASREPEAVVAVAPFATETRDAGATELSGETEPAIPTISWVDYREERLRELELCEKDLQEVAKQRGDIDNSGMHDGGDELSEVQQLLKQRMMKRGFGIASAAAEQLLMQSARPRSEWKELCARTGESLQQQLHQHIEPLAQHMARDLQQLEEALEGAASRAEGAAETKRLRLSRESWESGFVALAEERHVALQSAASNLDAAAASLGNMLEQETHLAEEIAAMKAEIRGFDNTSDDLRLLADIRHKESIVKAFERLSGVRIQRVSTTGLVAELAWPRSLPAAATLQNSAENCGDAISPQGSTRKLFSGLYGAADYPAASTRITISWSKQETQQAHLQGLRDRAPMPVPVTTINAAAAAAPAAAPEPATPIRQRVQIVRPCLPPGGLPTDSAVCTPLLASRRGRTYGADTGACADTVAPAAADAAAARTVGAAPQWNQPQPPSAAAEEPRFLPITSCKLQSRFPLLRAATAAAASGAAGDATNAETLPPHRRWMLTVEQLRYFLLGAVQRSLQQILIQQGSRYAENGELTGAPTAQESFCVTSAAGAAPVSHLRNFGMRGLSGSGDISSRSSTETGSGSSAAEAAEGCRRVVGAPPFPDLSTVRALLLHAHASAGRVALIHDQLLLLLHAFTSVTSVDCTLASGTLLELPQELRIDLGEALTRGSLLLAVEAVEVKCLSVLDDMCTDGQEACKALQRAVMARLEALWDSEKETLSSEGCIVAFSDEGLVDCVYSACNECGYSCSVEDWQPDHGATTCPEEDNFFSVASWGSAEAAALERWTALLEDAGIVPSLL